jgi:hypothetical protein
MSFGRIIAVMAGICLVSFGCAKAPSPATQRPSESDEALGIQIVRTAATKKPQMKQLREIQLSGMNNAANMAATTAGGYTYSGPIETKVSYQPIPLKPLETFVIVEFNVLNADKKSLLPASDLLLVDGKGADHAAVGIADASKENAWIPFDSVTVDPGQPASLNSKWIFEVPEHALKGASMRFHGVSYPLSIK